MNAVAGSDSESSGVGEPASSRPHFVLQDDSELSVYLDSRRPSTRVAMKVFWFSIAVTLVQIIANFGIVFFFLISSRLAFAVALYGPPAFAVAVIVSIVWSHLSVKKIKDHGLGGRPFALWALVISYGNVLFFFAPLSRVFIYYVIWSVF